MMRLSTIETTTESILTPRGVILLPAKIRIENVRTYVLTLRQVLYIKFSNYYETKINLLYVPPALLAVSLTDGDGGGINVVAADGSGDCVGSVAGSKKREGSYLILQLIVTNVQDA